MKMSDEEKEKIWEMIKELRAKYDLHDPLYEDVDERAYEQWIQDHDHIPDIEEIDKVIQEVREGVRQ